MRHISRHKPQSLARDLHCNLYELRYRKRLYEDSCYYKRVQDQPDNPHFRCHPYPSKWLSLVCIQCRNRRALSVAANINAVNRIEHKLKNISQIETLRLYLGTAIFILHRF